MWLNSRKQKKAVHDSNLSRIAFFGTHPSDSYSQTTQVPNDYGRGMHPKSILRMSMRSNIPKHHVENKVDALVSQLTDLALLIRNTTTLVATQSDKEHQCSYCKNYGHSSNRCMYNPRKEVRCSNCHKLGHQEENCWSPKKNIEATVSIYDHT